MFSMGVLCFGKRRLKIEKKTGEGIEMKKTIGILGVALVAILAVQSTYGATRTWKGNGTGTTAQKKLMSRDNNWVGVVPVSGDIMQFNSSSANATPNMGQNFLVEQIKVNSTLTKDMRMAGNSSFTFRLRSTDGNGITVAGTKDMWLDMAASLRQDNAIFGGGAATEVSWITTGTGKLILSPGAVTLEQDMQMDVQNAGGVIDIRTPMTGYAAGQNWDVRKTGNGTLVYGAAMGVTGDLTIEGGTLELGAAQAVNSLSDMAFQNGTTLKTMGFGGTQKTLQIDGTVVFDMGNFGTTVLNFADSSGVAWGSDLDIINFGGSDVINFGVDGLSESQLADITINGVAADLDASGNLVAIPEPAAVALMLFSGMGIVFFRRLAI
jgi:hypothetical protein